MHIKLDDNLLSLIISLLALIVAIIALVYTIGTFVLKKGNKLRGSISVGWTWEGNESFIQSVLIENLKDKPVIIFKVYYQMGYNNYLEIEDFTDSPLILKPFEVYYKEYDPIILYTAGMNYVDIESILKDTKIQKRLVLSTISGRYKIKSLTKDWNLTNDYFKNYSTLEIRPSRLEYNGKSYGPRVKFLVHFKNDKYEKVTPIKVDEYETMTFKSFGFTKESIESKESVEKFLKMQIELGNLEPTNFEVIDFQIRVKDIESKLEDKLTPEKLSFFNYFVINRIVSICENWKADRRSKVSSKNIS